MGALDIASPLSPPNEKQRIIYRLIAQVNTQPTTIYFSYFRQDPVLPPQLEKRRVSINWRRFKKETI